MIASPLVSLADTTTAPAASANGQQCSTVTLVSGAATKTAGYHQGAALADATAGLSASNYTLGTTSGNAFVTVFDPAWVNPTTDSHFVGSSAVWISTAASNQEASTTSDQWRLFEEKFTLPTGAVVSSAQISYTADDAADVHLNGNVTAFASTGNTYGAPPATQPGNYSNVFTGSFAPVSGVNTLSFVARNWGVPSGTNPTGLLYKAVVTYCVPTTTAPANGIVHIFKDINGVLATSTPNNVSFPMITPTYENAAFTLGPDGHTTGDSPYEASTGTSTGGSTYTAYEDTATPLVGATCTASSTKPYVLQGYSVGSTLAQAQAASTTLTAPVVTINGDQYIIVRNATCTNGVTGGATNNKEILVVTSIDGLKTSAIADGTFANGWKYLFHITAPTYEPNLAMKFADWVRTGAGGILPVANNMRISSAQANNGGATVLLTAANAYSAPLTMTSDLDTLTVGRQVDILVEVAVPTTTVNGSYTTTYGVQSNP